MAGPRLGWLGEQHMWGGGLSEEVRSGGRRLQEDVRGAGQPGQCLQEPGGSSGRLCWSLLQPSLSPPRWALLGSGGLGDAGRGLGRDWLELPALAVGVGFMQPHSPSHTPSHLGSPPRVQGVFVEQVGAG